MAYKLVILDSAQNEREEIVRYLLSVSESSRSAAVFLDSVSTKVHEIGEHPQMYPLSYLPELAKKGYRSARVGSYVLLYTVSEDTVFVEHIFHQRRDYASLV